MKSMKNIKNIVLVLSLSLTLFSSCDLLSPGEVINPNVTEDKYLNSYKSIRSWRLGLEREMAVATGVFVELTEILSDNYFNNYTLSSKVFDFPKIDYQDVDVARMQRACAKLRESAIFGIEEIEPIDKSVTNEDRFVLYLIKGYSYLLAGETFVALPILAEGEVKSWRENLTMSISDFAKALSYASNNSEAATAKLLMARAYYRLGEKDNAVKYATESLTLSNNLAKGVNYDGINGLVNPIQTYVYGFAFQPLPRLDFLDPKYFQLQANEQRSIMYAKSEEAYLILSEAKISDNKLDEAKDYMCNLLDLVMSRPIAIVNDQIEKRGLGYTVRYPDSESFSVASSKDDVFRKSLVLTRKAPALVSIPYISGTSVTKDMILNCITEDDLLEVLYLMRQEIFFAEGRRVADLGIRLPVAYSESVVNSSASEFTEAQIPNFIPGNQEMDLFSIDEKNFNVVIKHNMNRVIVQNKNSAFVVPFI